MSAKKGLAVPNSGDGGEDDGTVVDLETLKSDCFAEMTAAVTHGRVAPSEFDDLLSALDGATDGNAVRGVMARFAYAVNRVQLMQAMADETVEKTEPRQLLQLDFKDHFNHVVHDMVKELRAAERSGRDVEKLREVCARIQQESDSMERNGSPIAPLMGIRGLQVAHR